VLLTVGTTAVAAPFGGRRQGEPCPRLGRLQCAQVEVVRQKSEGMAALFALNVLEKNGVVAGIAMKSSHRGWGKIGAEIVGTR
jgi:hypothetical protein